MNESDDTSRTLALLLLLGHDVDGRLVHGEGLPPRKQLGDGEELAVAAVGLHGDGAAQAVLGVLDVAGLRREEGEKRSMVFEPGVTLQY